MNNKYKYKYYTNLTSKEPHKEVKIVHKNKIQQIFCKHTYLNLIREKIGQKYESLSGDEIEIICPKCGKSKGKIFAEYEGIGYK